MNRTRIAARCWHHPMADSDSARRHDPVVAAAEAVERLESELRQALRQLEQQFAQWILPARRRSRHGASGAAANS